jgi:hypothetical protein
MTQESYSAEIRNLVRDLHAILGSEKLHFLMKHADDSDEIAQNLFGIDYSFICKKIAHDKTIDVMSVVDDLADKHVYPRDIKKSIILKKTNGSHSRKSFSLRNHKEAFLATDIPYTYEKFTNPQSFMLDFTPDNLRELEAEILLDARNRKMMKEFGEWKKALKDRIHNRNYVVRYNETHNNASDIAKLRRAEGFEQIEEAMSDLWRTITARHGKDEFDQHVKSYDKLVEELTKKPKQLDEEALKENDYQWAFSIVTAIIALKNKVGADGVASIMRSIYS